jgi:signal transduction histidine kinase/CheY-like chemotaxis protein
VYAFNKYFRDQQLFRGTFFLLLVFQVLITFPALAQPEAETGVLDLRNEDFFQDRAFELKGDFEFYWNELLAPGEFGNKERAYTRFPALWNDTDSLDAQGYASYRVIVLLPDSIPPLALSIPDMYSSYRIYADGKLVGENGIPAKSEEDYKPKWLPQTVSLPHVDGPTLQLVIQIANFDHSKGGISQQIMLGNSSYLFKKRENSFAYAYGISGVLFMSGFFFLGLYLFGRHDKAMFYFALFCLIYIYRIIGFGDYQLHHLMPGLPWILTVKLEYVSLFMAPYLFGLFTKHLYPAETTDILIKILGWICIAFTAVAIFLSPEIFTLLVNPFFAVIVAYIAYAVYIFVNAARNGRIGARLSLAATIFVFGVFIFNMLVYYRIVDDSILINLSGYLFFFCLQSLILAYRSTHSLKNALKDARQASNAKSRFLSTMSHEIRTPLNAIIGLSGLQLKTTREKSSKNFARTIKRNGENLLRMFNNFIDYSTIISGDLILREEVFSLENLLDEIRIALSSEVEAKNLGFSIEVDEDIPPRIRTDRQRLFQVITNLADNALKFTEDGGIRIEVDRNKDELKTGNIRFSIRDTGIGIKGKDEKSLFKSFSQIDSSLSRQYGGTGFGLALSKEIVKELGGSIWFEENEPKGAIFSFTIKAEEVFEKETPRDFKLFADGRTISFKKPKILLAEDNEVNQVVALSVLDKLDLEADVAENGQLVLQRHSENDYDIIFMDIEMPHMNGIETTIKLREQDQSESRPIIIALTANALPEDRQRCLDAGMDDFIPKPISIDSMRLVLDKWISTI